MSEKDSKSGDQLTRKDSGVEGLLESCFEFIDTGINDELNDVLANEPIVKKVSDHSSGTEKPDEDTPSTLQVPQGQFKKKKGISKKSRREEKEKRKSWYMENKILKDFESEKSEKFLIVSSESEDESLNDPTFDYNSEGNRVNEEDISEEELLNKTKEEPVIDAKIAPKSDSCDPNDIETTFFVALEDVEDGVPEIDVITKERNIEPVIMDLDTVDTELPQRNDEKVKQELNPSTHSKHKRKKRKSKHKRRKKHKKNEKKEIPLQEFESDLNKAREDMIGSLTGPIYALVKCDVCFVFPLGLVILILTLLLAYSIFEYVVIFHEDNTLFLCIYVPVVIIFCFIVFMALIATCYQSVDYCRTIKKIIPNELDFEDLNDLECMGRWKSLFAVIGFIIGGITLIGGIGLFISGFPYTTPIVNNSGLIGFAMLIPFFLAGYGLTCCFMCVPLGCCVTCCAKMTISSIWGLKDEDLELKESWENESKEESDDNVTYVTKEDEKLQENPTIDITETHELLNKVEVNELDVKASKTEVIVDPKNISQKSVDASDDHEETKRFEVVQLDTKPEIDDSPGPAIKDTDSPESKETKEVPFTVVVEEEQISIESEIEEEKVVLLEPFIDPELKKEQVQICLDDLEQVRKNEFTKIKQLGNRDLCWKIFGGAFLLICSIVLWISVFSYIYYIFVLLQGALILIVVGVINGIPLLISLFVLLFCCCSCWNFKKFLKVIKKMESGTIGKKDLVKLRDLNGCNRMYNTCGVIFSFLFFLCGIVLIVMFVCLLVFPAFAQTLYWVSWEFLFLQLASFGICVGCLITIVPCSLCCGGVSKSLKSFRKFFVSYKDALHRRVGVIGNIKKPKKLPNQFVSNIMMEYRIRKTSDQDDDKIKGKKHESEILFEVKEEESSDEEEIEGEEVLKKNSEIKLLLKTEYFDPSQYETSDKLINAIELLQEIPLSNQKGPNSNTIISYLKFITFITQQTLRSQYYMIILLIFFNYKTFEGTNANAIWNGLFDWLYYCIIAVNLGVCYLYVVFNYRYFGDIFKICIVLDQMRNWIWYKLGSFGLLCLFLMFGVIRINGFFTGTNLGLLLQSFFVVFVVGLAAGTKILSYSGNYGYQMAQLLKKGEESFPKSIKIDWVKAMCFESGEILQELASSLKLIHSKEEIEELKYEESAPMSFTSAFSYFDDMSIQEIRYLAAFFFKLPSQRESVDVNIWYSSIFQLIKLGVKYFFENVFRCSYFKIKNALTNPEDIELDNLEENFESPDEILEHSEDSTAPPNAKKEKEAKKKKKFCWEKTVDKLEWLIKMCILFTMNRVLESWNIILFVGFFLEIIQKLHYLVIVVVIIALLALIIFEFLIFSHYTGLSNSRNTFRTILAFGAIKNHLLYRLMKIITLITLIAVGWVCIGYLRDFTFAFYLNYAVLSVVFICEILQCLWYQGNSDIRFLQENLLNNGKLFVDIRMRYIDCFRNPDDVIEDLMKILRLVSWSDEKFQFEEYRKSPKFANYNWKLVERLQSEELRNLRRFFIPEKKLKGDFTFYIRPTSFEFYKKFFCWFCTI